MTVPVDSLERPSENWQLWLDLFKPVGQWAVPRYKDIPEVPAEFKAAFKLHQHTLSAGFGKLISLELDRPLRLPSVDDYYTSLEPSRINARARRQ